MVGYHSLKGRPVKAGLVAVIVAAIFAAGIGAGIGAMNAFATHEDPNTVHFCVNPLSKVARIVEDPARCARYEDVVDVAGAGTETGFTSVQRRSSVVEISAGPRSSSGHTISCDLGELVVGGGASLPLNLDSGLEITESFPSSSTSWTVWVENSTDISQSVTIYATCIS